MIDELRLIKNLQRQIPRKHQGVLGIGDDAEIFHHSGGTAWLASTDTIVEGVDFLFSKAKPEAIGHKALAVNLSDMAAMGAKPHSYLVTLAVSKKANMKWAGRLYSGLTRLASSYQLLCLGGDVTSAKECHVSITVIGRTKNREWVTRGGAKAGDWLGVTGTLGGSLLGKHLNFKPRVEEGQILAKKYKPHAMIDISDGFVLDLERLLQASRLGACVDLSQIPISADARKKACRNQAKALEYALTDGEDFELLFAVSPRVKIRLEREWKKYFPRTRLSWVGRIRKGKPVVNWTRAGVKQRPPKLKHKGYVHR